MKREKLAHILGVSDTEINASKTTSLPTSQTGHGFVRASSELPLVELCDGETRRELDSLDVGERRDLLVDYFEGSSTRFALSFPSPGYEVFGESNDEQVIFDGPNVALIDLATVREQTIVFTNDRGQGVYLELGSKLDIGFFEFSLKISPIREWMTSWNDTWLIAQLEDILELDTTWSHAVAVGLSARLGHTSVASERKARIEAMIRGEYSEPDPRQEWAAALEDELVDSLEANAIAALEMLATRLDELLVSARRRELEHEDDDLLDVLHSRDDIECVRWVIEKKRGARTLDAISPGIDAMGEELGVLCKDFFHSIEDQRMLRALGVNAMSWWPVILCGVNDEQQDPSP